MNDDMVAQVVACVREIVVEDTDIGPDTPIMTIPSMDSIAIFQLIGAAERAVGVSLAPELVVTETFATPRALAAALAASGGIAAQ